MATINKPNITNAGVFIFRFIFCIIFLFCTKVLQNMGNTKPNCIKVFKIYTRRYELCFVPLQRDIPPIKT